MSKVIYILAVIVFSLNSMAAESSTPLPEEKFAGIVQHTKGAPISSKGDKKKNLDFKDLIYFSETISVPKSARLKLITQKRCVAVLYENASVVSPKDKNEPWEIKKGPVRWICPENRLEKFIYENSEFSIQNGEFLFYDNRLVPFRDQVLVEHKPLLKRTVYEFKNGAWTVLKDQPEAFALWQTDQSYTPPTESSRNNAQKPEDAHVIRIFANYLGGSSGITNYGSGERLSAYNMKGEGLRLGTNFPLKNKSLLVFLDFFEAENPGYHKGSNSGPDPIGTKSIHTESFTAAVGLRKNHFQTGSYYGYLGLTNLKYDFHTRKDNFDYDSAKLEYKFAVTGGIGYQKIFFSKSWLSLMAGAELRLTQSLTDGDATNYNNGIANGNPKAYVTNYALILYLGPVVNF
jgi:hypothetical protein